MWANTGVADEAERTILSAVAEGAKMTVGMQAVPREALQSAHEAESSLRPFIIVKHPGDAAPHVTRESAHMPARRV
jgi:hypothetical protein